ncbi:hypothetical protein [Paucibacter sp. DJ2R-2]|uniref:hypothetical protein n=1 Tax=Paucibacter sp. DJ2R-2 TaxID=2893558 RepID=UPI0021E370D4|nr:hypothetical protein [Paucibacter sp. DJ2R-2]MCV2420769.1 hypothetical protein [Paucibacter sp. DJ4R-1]MCV2439968.1 hypothetical protein [Paucibacter sp. DJ2R-2]
MSRHETRQRLLLPVCAGVAMLALLTLSPAVRAQAADCLMVFGHGRNYEPAMAAQNAQWDQVNLRFNRQVVEVLNQAARPAHGMVLQVAAVDLARNLGLLLTEAEQRGCAQVLETTVFADAESATFKARLRLYPVLGLKGPRAADAGLSIGQALYTNERGFELSARSLERLRPELLARAMTEEFLAARSQATLPEGQAASDRQQ